ncbi:hypothetical protein HZS_6978 [Henneguya salminicola]|nr:hypothetical protein HZS_6978 [Henneguya salminicola]
MEQNISKLLVDRNKLIEESTRRLDYHYKNILTEPYDCICEIEQFFEIYNDKKQLPSIKTKTLNLLTDIFIDLVPGYKILNDDNETIKHQKNIKKINSFEREFLRYYTNFVQLLITIQKDLTRIYSNFDRSQKNVECLALKNLFNSLFKIFSHMSQFNHCEKIFNLTILSCVTFRQSLDCEILYTCIEKHFINDTTGNSSLQIIKYILKYFKENSFNHKLVDTFIKLPINDLKELKTTNTEILSIIFTIYFRVLKNPISSSKMLSSCLKGILQYATLLNIEIYFEMIQLILHLLKNDVLKSMDKLNIALSILKFPEINNTTFSIDYSTIYEIVYKIIIDILYGIIV